MSETLMVWLRIATRLVLVQLMAIALTLLGLVLLGAAPAATATARVVGPVRRDESLPIVRTMWVTWRASLLRSNLAAAPSGALALAAGTNLLLLLAVLPVGGGPSTMLGLVVAAAVVVLVLALLAWLIATTLLADPDLSAGEALRASVLFPLAFPGTALSLLVTLAAVGLVCATVPPVAVLWGGSATMLATELLVSARRRLLAERLAAA